VEKKEARDQEFNPKSKIPNSALFAVRTPTAVVTDLGTEFGVEVSDMGETQSYVFRGSVQLQQTGVAMGQESPGNTIILQANEAASVKIQHGTKAKAGKDNSNKENKLVFSRGEFDATAFVLPEQLPRFVKEYRLKPFRRWQVYSQELRKDPALVAYYTFEQMPPAASTSVLPNRSMTGSALDGRVDSGEWVDGRLPNKLALRLNGPADGAKINIPVVMDDFTLATWVYIESLDNILNSLLLSDGWWHDGQLHWQLQSDGLIRLHVYGLGDKSRKAGYDSLKHLTPDQFKRWTHLAVVYDHVAAKLWFYINSVQTNEISVRQHMPIRIGAAGIGNWDTKGLPECCRNFHGCIDEFTILSRAFSADEIRRMFEAGNPEFNDGRTDKRPTETAGETTTHSNTKEPK
jgi:hypothetical protein